MLRSRLYLGMFPVAGLLIAICLYSIYNDRIINKNLNNLQTKHYNSISKSEQVLLASTQLERAIRLRESGLKERSLQIYEKNIGIINDWLEWASLGEESYKKTFEPKLNELKKISEKAFSSNQTYLLEPLDEILDEIETVATNSNTIQYGSIVEINATLKRQSKVYYYIVLSGIVGSILLMGIVAFFLSQRILVPIDRLTQAATDLADNDWETDYTPTSKDEIAALEGAFVEMATRISTFKHLANKTIALTQRRMEECFSNLPYPIFFINSERKIVYRNPSAAKFIDLLGWDKALPPSLAHRTERVFGTGEEMLATDFEETVSFKVDDEIQHFLPTVVRINSDDVKEIECALILQDVTNLRLSDELKSDLVATISHEIKTPVTSATMALHLVLERSLGELNEDQADMIETATSDLKRLQHLLEHMLQIARLEQKSPQLNFETIAPSQLIQSTIELHAQIAENKDIDLKAEAQVDLPNIRVDSKLIEIAFSNLISNAVKYSDAKSTVTIYARFESENIVRFGVLDHGPGIPEEDTERVFGKFYRSSGTRSKDGTGLGLSICKDIVTAHNGRVAYSKRSPKGSDFHFTLPSV